MPPVSDPNTKPGVRYWRSLDELADTPQYRAFVEKEFADYDPDEMLSAPSRRSFMKLMAASMALSGATLTGCRRWPEQKVAPYVERPEGHVPGVPEYFATSFELGGWALPILAASFDGRPIKIEGNPKHPASGGASTALAQASVLDLYDPDRSRTPSRAGKPVSWGEAEAAIRAAIGQGGGASGGEGGGALAILSEATASPTVAALRAKLPAGTRWYEYEPVSRDNETLGLRQAFGTPVRAQLNLAAADVIVCLDADPLGLHPDSIANARGWGQGRSRVDESFTMSRMYCVEPSYSLTGTNADDRLAVKASRVAVIARAIAAGMGVSAAGEAPALEGAESAFVASIVKDLKAAGQKGVVTAGSGQPPAVHALAALINAQLAAVGGTVNYLPAEDRAPHFESIATLVEDLNSGAVNKLIIIGGNPVYDAPADLNFGAALGKAAFSAHLSTHADETSAACTWHLSRSHYLEAWGDARTWDGTVTLVQPLIQPLYDTRSAIELLALIAGDDVRDGYGLVRRTAATMLTAEGGFERAWRTALRNGFIDGTAPQGANVRPSAGGSIAASAAAPSEGFELVLSADSSVYDGRFANNAWMQETPDPISKLVWDNALYVSPRTAKHPDLQLRHGDKVKVTANGRTVEAGVFIQPGEAEGSVRLALGYGRARGGYVATGQREDRQGFLKGAAPGVNAYVLRTTAQPYAVPVTIEKTGGKKQLVTTQDHYAIDQIGIEQRQKRAIGQLVRGATVGQYKELASHGWNFVEVGAVHVPKPDGQHLPLQLFEEPSFLESESHGDGPAEAGERQWAMAIDLNACIGCNACMVACQAENNVPVVGKQECGRGREMHWIRIDRYFVSATRADGSIDPNEVVATVHQPLTCQQCENAPCEQVCPVAATVHDTEGLNVMIYNRCIGTRYCSNNCPYKVRRYNWFDWHYKPVHSSPVGGTYVGIPDQQQLDDGRVEPVRRLQFNPEVTVRMRGVMEKCSFCIQRIKAVTIPARNEGRDVADGEIVPACAQTCPTQGIKFGDLNDPNSAVAKIYGRRQAPGAESPGGAHAPKGHPRSYAILNELNTRPRNRYMGPVRNPALAQPLRDYDALLKSHGAPHGDHGHDDHGHGHGDKKKDGHAH